MPSRNLLAAEKREDPVTRTDARDVCTFYTCTDDGPKGPKHQEYHARTAKGRTAMRSERLEPHWPSLLAFFEQAARETRSKAKRAEFTARANEIREYLARVAKASA